MADLDRAGLIELLNRLGAEEDAAVLEAARALHRKAHEAELSWDELIRRDEVDDEPLDVEPVREPPANVDTAEAGRLIDRLLRKGVSDSLREDLVEMKRQIGDGTLDPEDARYVSALARRLGV